MRYMLMMHTPTGTGDYQVNDWSPEDFKAHIAFMHAYNKDLIDAGEWVDAQGLTPPGQAKLVRAQASALHRQWRRARRAARPTSRTTPAVRAGDRW